MAKMSVEIEGRAGEVIRVIQQLGDAEQRATEGDAGVSMATPDGSDGQTMPAAGTPMPGAADEASAGEWTEALAGEFLAGLVPEARRVTWHIWQGGASGIHRSALCQHAEMTPRELSLLVMRMGRALGGFQRERGMILSRPVAANSPLQTYLVDPGFAAVAESQMFDERMSHQLADSTGRP